MYRNIYLQNYKTSTSQKTDIQFLLRHFTQLYNTLGCVLQDLEYQVGRVLCQPITQPPQCLQDTRAEHIKIEKQKIEPKQFKGKYNEQISHVARISQKSNQSNNANFYEPNYLKKSDQASKSNTTSHGHQFDRPVEYENESRQNIGKEKVRNDLKNNIGTSSFDDLFNGGTRAYHSEGPFKTGVSNFESIRQINEQSSNPNTYEDIVDRIFSKQQDVKKKR